MPSTHPVISVSCLIVTWPDGSPALRDLDLALSRGRAGLVGANGPGTWTRSRRHPGARPEPVRDRLARFGFRGAVVAPSTSAPRAPIVGA
ncbi:hypothetical protein ABKW28_03615 [Nocardioides sp. 31GB23]|uniref:hypothetical protein n=1 Tax=Nocardioides sp. 31GB23 TaxID=3156065 RepID=UPI0032AEFEC6